MILERELSESEQMIRTALDSRKTTYFDHYENPLFQDAAINSLFQESTDIIIYAPEIEVFGNLTEHNLEQFLRDGKDLDYLQAKDFFFKNSLFKNLSENYKERINHNQHKSRLIHGDNYCTYTLIADGQHFINQYYNKDGYMRGEIGFFDFSNSEIMTKHIQKIKEHRE